MKYSILALFCTSFILGCHSNENLKENKLYTDLSTIELDIGKSATLKFSELFVDPIFIPLETNSSSLFSSSIQIVVTSDKIFIVPKEPRYSILIFGKDGKIFSKIDNVGRGPDEYIAFDYIYVNEHNQTISFFDLGNRCFVTLNFKGGVIKKIPAKWFFSEFFVIDQRTGYYIADIANSVFSNTNELFHLIIYNPSTKTYKSFIPKKIRGNFMTENSLYQFNGTIYYKPPELDTIYMVKGNNVIPRYFLDFKANKKPERAFQTTDPLEYKNLKKNGIVWLHYDFKESEKFIYSAHRAIGNLWYLHFRSKITNQSTIYNQVINDYLGQTVESKINFSDFPVALDKDVIVFLHEPSVILGNGRKLKSALTDQQLNKFYETHKDLLKLNKSLNDQDNPVLGFYRFR